VAGAFSVGVTSASLALRLNGNGTMALRATGSPFVNLPGSLGSIVASSVTVFYNNSGTDYTGVSLTVGTITALLDVAPGSLASPRAAV
jgi:hypothetical protein